MCSVMSVRVATPEDKKHWNDYVGHPLQTWAWGEFREAMGLTVARFLREEEDRQPEAWQLTFHRIGPFPYTIGYFPKGPRPSAEMVRTLKQSGIKHRAVSILVEPDVFADSLRALPAGLTPARRPLFTRYTFVLDLTKSEEKLMADMHPKTRYNIKVAMRHGVKISEDNSDKAFAQYLALHDETTSRQGFYAHSVTYMRTMWRIMHGAGIARLFTASLGDTVLAAWILFVWNGTLYYPYGASSRFRKNVMAPNLLLWELARWGKRNNLRKFDLWGALGPDPDPTDPWYGFHKFKQGFAPDLVEFAGSFDLVINRSLYVLFSAADSVRWAYLRTRKTLAR